MTKLEKLSNKDFIIEVRRRLKLKLLKENQ
jgi:hypothetical protein